MTHDPYHKKIKQALDQQLEAIETSTVVKLNEMRHDVVYQQSKGHFKTVSKVVIGVSLACVLAIALVLVYPNQNSSSAAGAFMFEDLELLSNEADTEFYQDIEFLTWLDENQLIETDI